MNTHNNFIVIEGLDGAGKSTQLKLLKAHLDGQGIPHQDIHFPMMNKGYYGTLVAEFLRGEFGAINEVDPKLVALLYAGDRKEHIYLIERWLEEGNVVIADRYVNSNIAYQCAKYLDNAQKETLTQWILEFEFEYHQLPKPAVSLFLDVPFDSVKKSLTTERTGEDRDYLEGKKDIHEASISFQEQVRQEYLTLTQHQDDFHLLKCYDKAGNFHTAAHIHEAIKSKLAQLNVPFITP